MKKLPKIIAWLSIVLALASAVVIAYVPSMSPLFLTLLIVNMLLPIVFFKGYEKPALVVCRLLVGGLFIFSSFTKGVDPLGTKYKMLDYFAAYGIEWLNDYALVLAMAMILAEFIVGICLFTNIFSRLAVLGATLLMVFFTITTLFDALYDVVPDCGCFGTAVKMTNWQTFYKNLVIDAVLLPLIIHNRKLGNKLAWRTEFCIGCLYAVLFLAFEIYNYRHLPVVDFMNWKIGRQMKQENTDEQRIYLIYKNKTTGETHEYLSPNYPWNDSVWMSEWEFVDQRTEGGESYIGFTAYDADGEDVTEMILSTEKLLMFTSSDLNEITEGEWGKMEDIAKAASNKGFNVIWLTEAEPAAIDSLQGVYPFVEEVYYGDELEIKTIVRYNPGLIYLDDGLVIDKWSAIDFPTGDKLNALFEK